MAAMKTSQLVLMLLLLLGAVVAAHGRHVSCKNKCPVPVTVGGVKIAAGATVDVEMKAVVELSVKDKRGVKLSKSFVCPADVKALVVVYEKGYVKVKVAAVVGLVSGILETVMGLVLGLIKCTL